MDRIACMETFVKIVAIGRFSAAARFLGKSPALVTGQIQSLENSLGVRLLNRTTRKISVTEAGQAYYAHCLRVFAELDEGERSAQALQSAPRGMLRLSVSTPLLLLIAPVIKEFSRLYLDVAVDLTVADGMVDLLQERFDLAVREAPATNSSFITRTIGTYRLVVCGSPDYFARRGVPREPADLAQHDCLCHSGSIRRAEWQFDGPRGTTMVRVCGNLKGNSEIALRIAAVQGQGVCMAPSFLVADELKTGRLVAVLQEFLKTEHAINAIYPHRQHLPVKVRCFIDLLVWHFRTALASRTKPKSDEGCAAVTAETMSARHAPSDGGHQLC